jgi:hypothetical protein
MTAMSLRAMKPKTLLQRVAAKHDESDALHARARAMVTAYERRQPMPEPFDALARDLGAFQAKYVAGYARLCASHPGTLPAVPTEAFKVARVSAFDEGETPVVFRTSGTTAGARGAHWFRTCATYDAGAVAFARRLLELEERLPVLVIGPTPEEQADSSLVHMVARFVEAFGTDASGYYIEDGVLDVGALDERVAKLMVTGTRKVLVLGTSLAYAHLLDALGDARFRLPDGARVMQTGGFKGRERTIDATKLTRDLARAFCIEPRAIVSEYGMTELSSQFWNLGTGTYVEPPWARVIPVDPETLAPVPDGDVGVARIEDLLNVDSAFAVVTADRVKRVAGGFELLGRAPGAPPRGCSIATEEMLG